jgi:hypothetical protein
MYLCCGLRQSSGDLRNSSDEWLEGCDVWAIREVHHTSGVAPHVRPEVMTSCELKFL